MCTEAGIPIKTTPKDGICLDAEATRDSGDPVLRAYSLYTSSATTIKKVEMLKEGSKGLPLQTEFVNLLENGRCSTRIPKLYVGVQMQNLPKVGRMRNCFVARPGYAFVDIDYAMHELVTVAQAQIWLGGERRKLAGGSEHRSRCALQERGLRLDGRLLRRDAREQEEEAILDESRPIKRSQLRRLGRYVESSDYARLDEQKTARRRSACR